MYRIYRIPLTNDMPLAIIIPIEYPVNIVHGEGAAKKNNNKKRKRNKHYNKGRRTL
jgi:hypothetical protein